jgi:hypothetical protein
MIKSILYAIIILCTYSVQAQVGIGTVTPNTSAVLDVESTTKGLLLPRLTTLQRDEIVLPVAGLTIFNSTKECLEWYDGVLWYNACGSQSSTNGTAIVSSYNCIKANAGIMTEGVPVSGVTQTITATVVAKGTYNISTTANGVTFSGSGTFSGTGAQDIVLTATGAPTFTGSKKFILNTTPSCNFTRTTVNASTNGSAVVSAYNCTKSSSGTMNEGVPVSGVTQTITATVVTIGTYNISTTANGVTFSGSGDFSGTGAQNIVLTASGTPTVIGSHSFTLNATPNCNFNRTTLSATTNGTGIVSMYDCTKASAGTITEGIPVSGVTQTITATVSTIGTYNISTTTNGVTFSGSGTFTGTGTQDIVLTASGTPTVVGSHSFTLNTTPNCNFSRITLSASTNGTGVVSAYNCSKASAGTMNEGVPVSGVTQTITATVVTIGTYSILTTANGVTFSGSGTFSGTGAQDIVLTAAGTPTVVSSDIFTLNTTPNCNFDRPIISISTNGTAVVSVYNCTTGVNGTMVEGVPVSVSNVYQIITAKVVKAGTYNISTNKVNGVTFSGSMFFPGTGDRNVTLVASGTPTLSGSHSFTLNTTPNCNFSRATLSASTNGTGIVSAYNCTKASVGTMKEGVPVSGVTQTITATVVTIGTYKISVTANGVTFSGSGTFAGTGAQDIVLTATGTPTVGGTTSFTLNTNPNCYFDRSAISNTTNGTAVVSEYSCDKKTAGIMNVNKVVTGVSQTITATVIQIGTYDISTTVNGVTFSGSGTFAGTGKQDIVLNATGTPGSVGNFPYPLNVTPGCNFSRPVFGPTSNGTAVVSKYLCETASVGTMAKGVAVNGVTQTITATVSTIGTYSISTTANGVTFVGAGTFDRTGLQGVILTATGAPKAVGSHNFTLNTLPDCSFSRITNDPSSNGTAEISGFSCGANLSDLKVGKPINEAYQTITATVVKAGTYNISATANGVTLKFGGSANVGFVNFTASAKGTPVTTGSTSFIYDVTPSFSCVRWVGIDAICNGSVPTTVVDITSSTGKIWMDRNLGASSVANSGVDYSAYGCLYQWGRGNDGHASITWKTSTSGVAVNGLTTTLSTTDTPGDNLFIRNGKTPYDWRSTKKDLLWQGVSGVNNPCPTGYRVPTYAELTAEVTAYNITDSATAFSSPHKFVLAGIREPVGGSVGSTGTIGAYWSSTVSTTNASKFSFLSSSLNNGQSGRAYGLSVRCIKN